jgi:hypothetical protein
VVVTEDHPAGLLYREEFVTPDEEAGLIERVEALDFRELTMRGQKARRPRAIGRPSGASAEKSAE